MFVSLKEAMIASKDKFLKGLYKVVEIMHVNHQGVLFLRSITLKSISNAPVQVPSVVTHVNNY